MQQALAVSLGRGVFAVPGALAGAGRVGYCQKELMLLLWDLLSHGWL